MVSGKIETIILPVRNTTIGWIQGVIALLIDHIIIPKVPIQILNEYNTNAMSSGYTTFETKFNFFHLENFFKKACENGAVLKR